MSEDLDMGREISSPSSSPSTPSAPRNCRTAMIVTGEASGDLHGANLIRAAGEQDPGLSFFGIGGRLMADAGCRILVPAEELSVMGLVEVLGHFPVIRRAFNRLKRILQGEERPDVLILIDFPGFNLRLAREAHRAGVPVLYYVSPKVWAWRRGRVKEIARVVDRLAVIFPFEPSYYQGEDLDVEYVGNPLMDEAGVGLEADAFLAQYGLESGPPVVGLFPGSRENEIRYCFETLLDSAELIVRAKPDVRFLLPVALSLDAEDIRKKLEGRPLPVTLVEQGNIYETANACDAVITVSGTVTLQTALVGTPMAIIYKMSPVTFAIGKRLVKVPHIGLANIVAGKGVVREFIQEQATGENIAEEILRMLDDREYSLRIRQGLSLVREKMGESGCSLRVARMASEMSRGIRRSNGTK